LSQIPRHLVEPELADSKRRIEDAIGRRVDTLAYPYGAHNQDVRQLAARHFTLACTTKLGFSDVASDRFAVERLDMYYLQREVLFRSLFSRWVAGYLGVRRGLRSLRTRFTAAA